MKKNAPILFIKFENKKFTLTEEGKKLIQELPNKKFKVISMIGEARKGKSFLIGKLMKTYFEVGNEIESCTHGIWASVKRKENYSGKINYLLFSFILFMPMFFSFILFISMSINFTYFMS